MANETRQLAKFAADLTYEQIPASMRALAVNSFVDQMGCIIGGTEMVWSKQVRDTYRKPGGSPEATVVGYGDRLPVGPAAFINGTFGHSFEFDDGNTLVRGHPGAELVAPVMAVAEREHASGRDFLTAFIAGYEVRGHIGWAIGPDATERGGPQETSTCSPFGVAAGVGKLLGLGADGIHNALGIAGGYTGGLMQYDHGGGSVKRIYAAIGASGGIQAAHLAQAGMTGPEEILEGERGVLKIFASKFRPERLVAEFGKKWMVEHVRIKPYSSCGAIHPAIDGFRKIVSGNNLEADGIESVEVGYPRTVYDHVAITSPHDLLGMQFSTSYSLALTILKGANTPREYTMEALADPEIRAFASRVRIREDADLTRLEGKYPARVKVRTKAGGVHEELVLDPRGSPGRPLSNDEIDDKFRSQAAPVLGAEGCDKVLRTLRNVDALDDMARLFPMLVFSNAAAKKPG